jgi:ribosome-binding protein aMBF1 (putative translation factor)
VAALERFKRQGSPELARRQERDVVKKAVQATLNRLLKAARQGRGWTQRDVADRIGAPLALNVGRWERGATFPSAYYLQQLCHLFGKSPRELG